MQTGKKGLALLLALLMVFSLLPGSALAADGCLTAKSGAATAYETTQGALLEIPLAGLFTDSEGHALTYTLDDGDYGTRTKIVDGKLSFTNSETGEYTPTVTAKCANGETASVTLTITVNEAAAGDESQYGYDETPAKSVKVYVTISSDGVPLVSNDGTVLSHLEVNVPYFDLEKQELSDFYRYHTENGSGSYVDGEIVERPTALHLYLYMLGVYYLGYTPEEIMNGDVQIVGHDGGMGVFNLNGDQAYEDTSLALNITGSATSLYMEQFWGHDENLMYYRNHVYPLMGSGWGSTADYILLSDGDTIDVAMFSNWNFWTSGAFAAFDADDYAVSPGSELNFSTVKYDTKSVADGGTEEFDPITGLNVAVYDADWTLVEENLAPTADDGNEYAYTFDKEGVYYLLAMDPNAGTNDSCYAPATAKVIVGNAGGGEEEFDPATYYADYDFSYITLDEEGTDYIYNIEESTTNVQHFSNPGDKKLYTVTVPDGTDLVYVTYPAETDIVKYCATFDAAGEVTGYSCQDFAVTSNDDGSKTLTISASYLMENEQYFAAEDSSYDYFNCFNFIVGDNTRPGAAVKVTGVTLNQTELTVDRRATAQLTATVTPENAANTRVNWKSSDTSVATVSTKGVVTGVSAGTATITATTADGGFKAECTVTVTDTNKPVQAEDGYYEIATGEQLKWFADEVNSDSANVKLNARLTKDIDLSSVCGAGTASWQPIGDNAAGKRYSGIFDGQDHTISGLYIKKQLTDSELTNGSSYYTGLFGQVDAGTVKNLSVSGSVDVNGRYVAGIAGRVYEGTLENCHNYVTLAGEPTNDAIYGHAGVVANAQSATITNCSNHAAITGRQGFTAGVVAQAGGKTVITGCWNEGDVQLRGVNTSSSGYFLGVGGIVGKINTGFNNDGVVIQNCYNTGKISCYYRTQAQEQRLGGIAGNTDSKATNTKIINCYNTGAIAPDEVSLPKAKMGGIIGYAPEGTVTVTNSYYLEGTAETAGVETGAAAFTAETGLTAGQLGDAYADSCPTPVLAGQTVTEHADNDSDGKCDTCGKQLVEIAVPTRKANYPAESSDKAQTGKAYLLSDLQGNKVFDPVEGETLTYENYYYERSTDGGKTWGAKIKFEKALFGATLIQLTETEAGTYTYRFYASHDGVNFSKDTWTLTLTVEDAPKQNFTFNVGKDYTGGYPVIKLYEVDTDEEGNEILGAEIENVFLYSNFTSELPEGEEEYDAAQGKLVNNYQTFYATLTAGRYAYRAFAKNADTGEYDVALGGMTLDLPTDKNVDGGAGGGDTLYLQCNSFYVTSRKADNTYFTADEYHVEVVCPIMGTTCVMGDPYVSGSYTYYPTVLYAAGNACLYNTYAYPDIDGYIFTQNINQTFPASNAAGKKSLTINTAILLNVTVPADATFGLYFQWNNFNTTEIEPDGDAEIPAAERWTDNEDGTKSTTYSISKSSSNYTWRLSDSTHVTQAGWLASQSKDADMTFSFGESAATNRISHDSSKLGTQTAKRDEADLQVNLDPSGFETLSGKTRVRAYRHWQLINSDAGNIMVEPDFHWNLETGDAEIETVNGGNTTANWADITPGTQDSIITVYYDSIDVNPGNYGSHGGLFPATAPQRVGVIIVGGTDVTHGTADADVDFNMAADTATTRSMDWDYNYDTWYYEASETDPTLDFAVSATGDVTVEYAFVATSNDMRRTVTGFANAAQQEDGRYAVPLKELNNLGNRKGGTVIIKMTDSTGVSYRLVRVAQVTITAENVSNPEEDIMPGDQVKLTFSGMFRGVNKISGIFNPTVFKPAYYAGETKFEGTLAQYQKMDNASVTVTIPTDIEFAEGEDTAEYAFTNGYTFGSMYSAANPFRFIYEMTDVGVGTNFNAVTVTYFVNRYADAVVTVHRKVTYETAFAVTDASGHAIDGVTVTLTGPDGSAVEAGENGHYELGYGAYTYELSKSGYVVTRGSFTLGSADADKVVDGILTITTIMEAAGANAWDGTTVIEPRKDDEGTYLIGTATELAWFAQNGSVTDNAKLTADIELASHDWTPIRNFSGSFDGQGHVVRNLYINSSERPLGLFGYLKTDGSVTKLGITGNVTCTDSNYSQIGGIVGYMERDSSITQCWSAVNVTTNKHGGGIAGYTSSGAIITDCYATGTIRALGNECYIGGICGSYYNRNGGAILTNCYSTAKVIGTDGNASYIGGLSPIENETFFVNSYYLTGTVSGESPKYGVTGKGTSLTAEEMKAADFVTRLGESFAKDTDGINGGYPVLAWQGGTQQIPGDVNGDGKIDASDAQLVYAYTLGEGTLTEIQILIADMDADGKITAKDAAMLFALVTSAAAEVTE